MQAVMFVAGRGTRMGSLTETTPKPMLPLAGKPILEYKIEALPDSIDEVILIVGYMGSVIQKHFGGAYNGRRIFYVEQEELNGTAGALWQARSLIKGKFLAMNGDDIYSREDTEACLAYDWAMGVEERSPLGGGGKVMIDAEGLVHDVVENPRHPDAHGFIGTGMYVLDERVFDFPLQPKSPGSEEYGLPQTICAATHALGVPFHAVPATFWLQITEPSDIAKAEALLGQRRSLA